MKIYIVRHGQTDWNAKGLVMGDKDIPLNDKGIEQIERSAAYLKDKNISLVVSSPVLRCMQSAEIIAKTLNKKIEKDELLTEIGFGKWVGKVYQDLKKQSGFKPYYEFPRENIIPDGERFQDASDRVVKSYTHWTKESDSDILFVVHADMVKLMVINALGAPLNTAGHFRIDNGSVSLISHEKKEIVDFLNLRP